MQIECRSAEYGPKMSFLALQAFFSFPSEWPYEPRPRLRPRPRTVRMCIGLHRRLGNRFSPKKGQYLALGFFFRLLSAFSYSLYSWATEALIHV